MGRYLMLLLLFLIVALLLSLVANRALLQRARSYERLFNMMRRDPLGLEQFEMSENSALQGSVVFFGDSRARQWPVPPARQPGAVYANRGIDGHTSTQARLRFDAHVRPLQPRVVVVQVGVNDLVGIPLLPEQRDTIVAETQANIAAIVAAARDAQAVVILTTIFPPAHTTFADWLSNAAEVAGAIDEVNAFLKTLAGDDVLVMDTAVVLADDRGRVRDEYRLDLWHLSPEGYAALNQALTPLLAQALSERSRPPE